MWTRLSPKARRNALRILPFGVIWFLMAQVFLVSDFAATGSFADVPDTAIKIDPGIYFFATLAIAAIGCLVGAIELLYLNRRFAKHSLATKLVGKTVFYAVLLAVIIVTTFPIAAAMEMDSGFTDPRVWQRLRGFVVSKTSLGTGVQLTASLVVSLFYSEISEHLGPQVLRNFMTGRYHTPKDERRVFLFSDMKSSTQIAEGLGHSRYFELLKAYYDALADAIVENGGEVYQYIGDEIVVSWREQDGTRDNACIRCVRQMKRDLQRRGEWFVTEFGVAPDFRAGLQAGAVTTGEIGALKKEIVFTGDVLNQSARIQALCKTHEVDVLVGDELRRQLEVTHPGMFRSLGAHALRGKDQPVEVFALVDSGL